MDTTQEIQLFNIDHELKEFHREFKDFRVAMLDFKDKTIVISDQQTAILRRLDEERVFGSKHVDNLEKRVEKVEGEVGQLKLRIAPA
ncbi:MAG: hypothetical protein AAB666_01645 [Patescibacteria group bacterium]